MDLITMLFALLAIPVICFVFFFKGVIKIKSYKKEMKTNPDDKLKSEIRKQTIIMIVTGVIGTVTGVFSLYEFIIFMRVLIDDILRLATGAIPAM